MKKSAGKTPPHRSPVDMDRRIKKERITTMAIYTLQPIEVPKIQTQYRTIKTQLPVPESLPIFELLSQSEPRSMQGQPPIVWYTADDITISDKWGNRWIDWSSGVLIANVGHGAKEIKDAIRKILDQGLIATYVFVHEQRAELTTNCSRSPRIQTITMFFF
jgi:4-aminobutyrate aminotransferase-like enzyme